MEEVIFTQMKAVAAGISDWSFMVTTFEAFWVGSTDILVVPAQMQEVLAKLHHSVSQQVASTTLYHLYWLFPRQAFKN